MSFFDFYYMFTKHLFLFFRKFILPEAPVFMWIMCITWCISNFYPILGHFRCG